jgi:hypothetical protein
MTAPQDEVTHDPADDRLLDVVVVGGEPGRAGHGLALGPTGPPLCGLGGWS